MAAKTKKALSPNQREELLGTLKARFEANMHRHAGLDWVKVQARLEANAEKLWSLGEMERTGGEPDVVGQDPKTGGISLSIARRKARRNAPVFATIVKHWIPERSFRQRAAPRSWRRPWASSS